MNYGKMKKLRLLLTFLCLGVLTSCEVAQKQLPKEDVKKIAIRTISLKTEVVTETKSFFGTLKFAKSTEFTAQQPGVITKLEVVPGQEVRQGQVIAVFPPMNHQLEVEQAKIQLTKTQQDYNRQRDLLAAGAVSKASVDDLKTQLDIEKKNINQLQRVNLIMAPYNGIITQVHASEGQEIGMGLPVFSMAQTAKAEVDFYVTPQEVSEIEINSPAFLVKNGNQIEGRITKKSIQLDERRKGYLVTSTFDTNDRFFAGTTVDIRVETGKSAESIWIPIDAMRKQGQSHQVFIAEDGKAIRKKITPGRRTEQLVQITHGLMTGEQLIIAGIDKLKDGSPINHKPAE